MSWMFLRIGFVKLLIFRLFSKVIQCNAMVKNLFMVIKKHIYKRVFIEGKMLTGNYPKRVSNVTANFWKLIVVRDCW